MIIAAMIEALLLGFLITLPPTPKPVPPSVVKLQVLQPAPVEQAKPPPPTPPPPVPQLPVPVAPPVPTPPPPPPRPHHAATKPRPVVHTPPPPPIVKTPMPPAPVTQAPPPSPVAQETAISHYTGMLRAIVLSHLDVPDQITESGLTSTSVLRFTVAPDGTITSAAIVAPSGIGVVNEAAMDALRASHFPAFIEGMPDHPLDFTLPVRVSGQADQ